MRVWLIFILSKFCFLVSRGSAENLTWSLENDELVLNEKKISNVVLQFSGPAAVLADVLEIEYEILDHSKAKLVNHSLINGQNASVDIEGVFLGRTLLKLNVKFLNDPDPVVFYMPIAVLRSQESAKIQRIFSLTLTVLVFANNIIMGLQLDWNVITGVLKRPIAPLIGNNTVLLNVFAQLIILYC